MGTGVTYKHAEAFCLMTYQSDDGTEEEIIWNSRDGVTPFVITMKSGKTGKHINWRNDRRVLDYVPQPGERIFIDLTREKAVEYARRNLRRWEDDGMNMMGAPTAVDLASEYLRQEGSPDIKVVE